MTLILLLQGGGRGTTNLFNVLNGVSHDSRTMKYEGEGWNSATGQRGRVGMSKMCKSGVIFDPTVTTFVVSGRWEGYYQPVQSVEWSVLWW